MVLRRLLSMLLIVSLLGLGLTSAWAGLALEDAPIASMPIGDEPTALEHDHCDHGCHFSAHLLGLTSSPARWPRGVKDRFARTRDLPLTTIAHAPPREPPRC